MKFNLAACLSLQALIGSALADDGYPGAEQPCMDLHIVCARGSDEPAGEGIIGELAYMASSQVPNSNVMALKYPATFERYAHSEGAGAHNLTKHIHHYLHRCPTAKIALLGYSQGAHVIGDTLYGNSETEKRFNRTKPLGMKYGKHIAAVVLMGDPTFHPGHSWDAGTSTRHGIFHRNNYDWAYPYAPVTRSYCDHGDPYCASGRSSTAHGEYVDKYKDEASQFIVRSYYRSLKPKGGVNVYKAPSYKKKHSGKHGEGGHSHNHNHNHNHHSHRSNGHHQPDDSGNGNDHDNASSTFRRTSSAIAWLLIPLATIMSL